MRTQLLTITGNNVDRIVVNGFLLNVYLEYTTHGSGTDVTIFRQVGSNEDTLLTVTNSNTNANYPIKVQGKDSTGAAISGDYGFPALAGELAVRVLGGDAAGILRAYFTILDDDVRMGRY